MRRRGHRAYALVVALGIAVILSAIALALITSQSSMSSNIAIARTDLAQAILVHQAREGLAVRLDDRLRVIDSTSLDKNFSLKYDDAALHVGWKANSGSVHRPRLKDYGIGKNFLEPGAVLPEASYDSRAKVEALGRIKLSPTQTAVDFNLPGRQVYTTVYSSSFPYAVAAPRGDVHLKSLTGFSNPTYKHAEEVASEVPFPAWVLAEGEVDVEKFPVGKAFSAVGQVNVSGGAVGLRTSIPRVGFATDVSSRLQKMSAELARGCLDKTLALTGAPLDPVGFIGLFTGRTEIASLFSAQQATMFPFVPVVSFQQTEGVVTVVLLHSPFPSDFRQSGGSDLADQLASKVKQREDAESERIKLRGEHAELYQRLKDDPENPDAKRWEKRLEALTQSITEVAGRIQKLDREIDKLKELLNDEVWNGVRRLPPQHAKEEGPYPKAGGSYLFLAEKFTEMMKRIVKGDWQGLVAEFFSYTRLYHLGGRNPEWHFPGLKTLDSDGRKYDRPEGLGLDWLSLKGTMTVPRGRNLKIRHPLQLRGDLWLQRGSTLHIVGDLEIIRPNLWHESNGDEVPPTDVGFPNGRLMIEEGATLKVDGNLTCNGGSAHEGSVLVAGPMDRVHPISSAIFCSGNFSSKHGIHPAVSMEELFSYAARDNSAFVPARDTIFHLSHVVPMLSRIIGPFEKRTCWFAEWATTTSVYWIKGVPILPVPTPMPQLENCMRPVFDGLSWVATIQLNLRLGPYFYPQSSTWLLGRGMTPILQKADPKEFEAILNPLQRLPSVNPNDIATVLKDSVGRFALGVANKLIYAALAKLFKYLAEQIIAIPYSPVKCSLFNSSKDTEQPPALKKFAKEVLGLVKTHFLKGTKDLLFKIRSVARRHYVGNPTMLSRELPGLLVYSQGSIKIGTSPRDSVLASGLFIAEKDLSFRTQRTIGTAISLEGDVTGNDFLYYPFFSSASLYNSVKFRNELEEMAPGLPSSKEPAQNFDLPGCRIIYQGWAK